MKNLISTFTLLFFTVLTYAQEINVHVEPLSIKDQIISLPQEAPKTMLDISTVVYSELSKVAYYEVLLMKNSIDIPLDSGDQLVIKNIEQIISKKRNQKLYTELED